MRFQLAVLCDAVNQLHADVLLATPADMGLPPAAAAKATAAGAAGVVSALPAGSLAARLVALSDRLCAVNSGALQSDGAGLMGRVSLAMCR